MTGRAVARGIIWAKGASDCIQQGFDRSRYGFARLSIGKMDLDYLED